MAERVGDQGGATPPPAGTPGTLPDPLDRRVAVVDERVRQLIDAQTRGRRQLLIIALLIVVMFVIFTFATMTRVRSNLQEEQLREAVIARVPDVRPDLERHLHDVARDVIPVYREQAVERLREVGPEVARAAIERLKQLPETSGQQLEEHLRASHDRVLQKLEPEITRRFPSLTDEQKKQILANYFQEKIDVENQKLADKLNTMQTNEAIRVHAVLEKFGVGPEEAPLPPGEREREFLHALVDVLMDSEAGAFAGLPYGSAGTRASGAATASTTAPLGDAAAEADQNSAQSGAATQSQPQGQPQAAPDTAQQPQPNSPGPSDSSAAPDSDAEAPAAQ